MSSLSRDTEPHGDSLQSRHQAVDLRVGMGRRAGDPKQVMRRGGPQHRIDVNAFFEQRFAEVAEILFVLNHYRNDWRDAVQDIETPRPQLAPEAGAHRQQTLLPLRLRRITSKAAPTAATDAAGKLAENTNGRAVCFKYSITGFDPAMNPPTDASDLLNVPMTMSTSSENVEVFRSSGAIRAEHTNALRLIDIGPRVILPRQPDDAGQLRQVALHAENAFRDNKHALI